MGLLFTDFEREVIQAVARFVKKRKETSGVEPPDILLPYNVNMPLVYGYRFCLYCTNKRKGGGLVYHLDRCSKSPAA